MMTSLYVALLLTLHLASGLGCGTEREVTDTPPTPLTCPESYEKVGDHCYHFHRNYSQPWDSARHYCQGMGGDLATIHTCDTFGNVIRHIHMTNQEVPDKFSYWVGGTDRGDEGAWFWVDGLPMAMGVPFWGEVSSVHEPSGGEEQNCAQLYHDDRYYMHDGECDQAAYALCQFGVDSQILG